RYFASDRLSSRKIHNRKKHLNGVQHLRAKKVWYDLFRAPGGRRNCSPCWLKLALAEPFRPGEQPGPPPGDPGNPPAWMGPRYGLQAGSQEGPGQRGLGSNCLLSSPHPEERLSREQEVVEVPEGGIEDWLEKRAQRRSSAQSSSVLPAKPAVFQYPPGWPPLQDLPPSLRAPPPGGWPPQPGAQWG
ncbi:zinc finger matrin-type protein 5, partial [Sarcophilus harrisii]|uniref:zinc finger matrin-type protein 5 n=1 Tax=Sarcophilus harrisii TaxID=9305 RepID=UPI001301F26A